MPSIIQAAGWPIWPLIACSILALALIVERFVALNARSTPEVAGQVTFVSPDRLVDEATRVPYYSVRLKITGALPDAIKPEQIYPGTPVESFISTGDRTFLEYLAKPIQDSFHRAFREE